MAMEDRLNRLEVKVDKIQDQIHSNHLELLSCFQNSLGELEDKVDTNTLKIKEHDGHFSLFAKILGLGSILGGWLGLRDLWPKQ